jgi:hypothetical protein
LLQAVSGSTAKSSQEQGPFVAKHCNEFQAAAPSV